MYRRILTATFLAGGCLVAIAADPAPIIAPRTFNHKTTGSSLGAVLDELAKQTGVNVGRTRAESDRSLRLDCPNLPFWEALEKIAKESDHRIEFSNEGRKLQLVGGADITYREVPVSVDRLFRVTAKKVQCTTELDRENSSTEVTLSLQWEPGFNVFLVEPPSKSLSGKDNTGADLRVLDEGQGRISVTGQGVDLPVRLRDVPRAAKTLTVIEGKFNVIGAVKMHDYSFEKPVASKEYRESIVEGVTVRIRTDFTEKNDLWSARVEYVYPEGGPVLESYEAAAWLLDNQIWLVSPDGKKRLDYNGGMEIVSQGERKAVVVYRFTDEAGIRMGKPEDWTFMLKTPTKLISTDVKFRLENIPLP